MKRLLVLVLASSILTGVPIYGQDNTDSNVNDEVRLAARLSLAQGVVWLKQRAAMDPEGWIIGPLWVDGSVGTTNMMLRYSKKMVWTPEFKFKNAVIFVQDTVGAPLRKVIQPQFVKQIGSNQTELLVQDPKGTISILQRVPVMEKNKNVCWTTHGIGDAALVAYALQQAGLPASDPVLQRVVENLQKHIATFGLPDQTWNLAWLTAVFAGTPGDQAKELTQRLTSRLLDGQITDGKARGLWGTLSIHHGLLAAMLRDYLAMLSDLQKKEALLKEKTGKIAPGGKATQASKAAQTAVDDLRETMDWCRSLTEREVCQRGFRLADVENNWILDPNSDQKITMAGADHMLYNQTVADMESTHVALLALSIAAVKGRLPAESWRPKLTRKSGAPTSSLPLPERSEAVFARAANALGAQQSTDGRWSECNQHQPVTKFDGFKGVLPVPSDPKSFMPLPSPITALSTAQGIAALDSIGAAIGMQRLMSGFKNPYVSGIAASRKEIETRLATAWPKPTVRPVFKREDFDLYLVLSHPLTGLAEAGAVNQDNDNLARALVLAANPTGSWGKALYNLTLPTSSRARYEALKEATRELNKAHIITANTTHVPLSPLYRDAEGITTAEAVLFLASYVENPAAVLNELAALPELETLRAQAVKNLTVKKMPPPATKPVVVANPPPGAAQAIAAPPAPEPAAKTPAVEAVTDEVPTLSETPAEAKPKKDETL